MGNSAPAPAPEPPIKDDGYKWPENLYTEMRDMAALSFLVYAFAYASDVARKVGGLQGLDLTDSGKIKKSATRDLPRSFTPQEILELLETNREALITHFPSSFEDGPNYDLLVKNLKVLQGTIEYAILLLLANVCVEWPEELTFLFLVSIRRTSRTSQRNETSLDGGGV
jgi:hypothetical protein